MSKKDDPTFSEWDQSLIARHLHFYDALASGKRAATTFAQAHFVEVIRRNAKPTTQHEIAYSHYLKALRRKTLHDRQETTRAEHQKIIATEKTIDELDEIQIKSDRSGRFDGVFNNVKTKLVEAHGIAKDRTSQAAIWVATLSGETEFTGPLERWMAEQFNTLSNVYTKAMDAGYLTESLGNPWTHRFLDGGHSLSGSWSAARGALEDDTFWQELQGWSGAYLSDLSSVVGMPVTSLSAQSLNTLESIVGVFGMNQRELVDFLSVNAVETAATFIPIIGALLNWSEPERAEFAKMIGATGLAAVISANPLLLLVALVCLARAYHHNRHSGDSMASVAKSVASGGALSGLVLATSAAITGPVWVGMVASIVVAIAAQKAGKKVDPGKFLAKIRNVAGNSAPIRGAGSLAF